MTTFADRLAQWGYSLKYDEGGLLRGYNDPDGRFLDSDAEGNFDQLMQNMLCSGREVT